jgi:hypothetical protein
MAGVNLSCRSQLAASSGAGKRVSDARLKAICTGSGQGGFRPRYSGDEQRQESLETQMQKITPFLWSGPHFKFNEAVSFHVACDTQAEVDEFWDKLSAGGQIQQCGWLKDKFGVSWQIVPTILPHLLNGANAEKSARVMRALLQMKKLDIGMLQKAYDG